MHSHMHTPTHTHVTDTISQNEVMLEMIPPLSLLQCCCDHSRPKEKGVCVCLLWRKAKLSSPPALKALLGAVLLLDRWSPASR